MSEYPRRSSEVLIDLKINGALYIHPNDIPHSIARVREILNLIGFHGNLTTIACGKCEAPPDAHTHRPFSSPCPGPAPCTDHHHFHYIP